MIKPEIKSNVPVPQKLGRPRSSKWLFLNGMEVGQSAHFDFELPEQEDEMRKFKNSLQAHASKCGKTYDRKFTIRTVENGVAIWRTE